MNRHEQRIKAFQILFQIDNDAVSLKDVKFKEMYSKYDYIKQLVDYYIEHQNDIDDKISSLLKNYTLDRISKVDRNVLRVSVTEIISTDIPKKVIINEAVKITKVYSDVNSFKFVNGVLKNFKNE